MEEVLVKAEDIKKYFPVKSGIRVLTSKGKNVHAVDGVSFEIRAGEIVGLVGESGSGKTTTGRLLAKLEDLTSGTILFSGRDIRDIKGKELMNFRRRVSMIFQDPYATFDPRWNVYRILSEPLDIHGIKGESRYNSIVSTMESADLCPPEKYLSKHPHKLSGGERQRVAIARAVLMQPEFVVADEPVSTLDVSIRADILDLLLTLKEQMNTTYLFLTHGLAVARYLCNRIIIMYGGQIVEIGPTELVINEPLHPYTRALLSAVPSLQMVSAHTKRKRVRLKGEPPDLSNLPSGCRFHKRCPHTKRSCITTAPPLAKVSSERSVRCHHSDDL